MVNIIFYKKFSYFLKKIKKYFNLNNIEVNRLKIKFTKGGLMKRFKVLSFSFLIIFITLLLLSCGRDENNNVVGVEDSTSRINLDEDFIFADFESGSLKTNIGTDWYQYTDTGNGGGSSVELSIGEGYKSNYGLMAKFKLIKGEWTYDPFVGFGTAIDPSWQPSDILTNYEGISYYYKGASHKIQIKSVLVKDHDYHNKVISASTIWKEVQIKWSDFMQDGWGTPIDLDLSTIKEIGFHISGNDGDSGILYLDNITFKKQIEYQNVITYPIQDPEIPELDTVTNLTITNPMQEIAMKYLDKGVNLTGMEDGRKYTEPIYPEETFQKLAQWGFKGVRIPIDLDQYVINKYDFVAGDTIFMVDTVSLFAVLDTIEAWTAKYRLSFTIDYHQYDGTFAEPFMNDSLYVYMVTNLWKIVANHFKNNPRIDIFYELGNEPELGTDTYGTLKEETWVKVAEAMRDSIRSVDTTHIIIFGHTGYYSRDILASSTPWDDSKVIYVFHNYDPFLFTHQGASWTGMTTVHDIPYPYSPDKWSENPLDFGVDPNVVSNWVSTLWYYYYKNGNYNSIYNGMTKVKRWAVENNVAIICNEFGSYARHAKLEDRLNYYRDVTKAFEALQIPWQHWGLDKGFNLVDPETGEPLPGILEALGLQ